MKVLVTGSTGFIGQHVVSELVRRGNHVHPLRRSTVDLTDEVAVRAEIADAQVDAAVLLGWSVEPGRYLHDEEANALSLSAASTVLAALKEAGCKRVVVAGTCLEVTQGDEGPSMSAYARAKRTLHQHAESLAGDDFAIGCGHIFWLYGPHEDRRRAVASVATRLLLGEVVDVTHGRQQRDFLHAADVASAMCTILETVRAFESFDVCSGEAVPMRDVFAAIAGYVGRSDLIRFGARTESADDTFVATGDPTALAELGWWPRWGLQEGLADTVEWWREELAHESRVET